MSGVTLDTETVDRIALASMKDHLNYLEEELRSHEVDGTWLHPEDYHKSRTILIPALRTLIEYYGG